MSPFFDAVICRLIENETVSDSLRTKYSSYLSELEIDLAIIDFLTERFPEPEPDVLLRNLTMECVGELLLWKRNSVVEYDHI